MSTVTSGVAAAPTANGCGTSGVERELWAEDLVDALRFGIHEHEVAEVAAAAVERDKPAATRCRRRRAR
jgi:hypothetical protein